MPDRDAPPSLLAAGRTDPGCVHATNEDQLLILELDKAVRVRQSSLPQLRTRLGDDRAQLLLVADGLGGHRGGAEASAVAVLTVEEFVRNTLKWFFHLERAEEQEVLGEFCAALQRADQELFRLTARYPELAGMGTTLTLAYCLNADLFVVHVGHGRCYLRRGGALHRLTRDHTVAAEMARRGHLSPREEAPARLRHLVPNVVGGDRPGPPPATHQLALEPGDVLLLCTDGLTEMLPDDRIDAVLAAEPDPGRACERLVAEAKDAGGGDNVTVIVAAYQRPSRATAPAAGP